MPLSLPSRVLALVLSQLIAAVLTGGLAGLVRWRFLSGVTVQPVIRSLQNKLTLLASIISLVLSLLLAGNSMSGQPLAFRFLLVDFYLDSLSIYFVLLVNVVALSASFYTPYYLATETDDLAGSTRFHLFFNLFHFTMVLVPIVDNLVLLWIAVELTTLVSTVLVGHRRDRRALEAAWKYLIITSTGIIFALLGTLFLANAIPTNLPLAEPMNWSNLVKIASQLDRNFVTLSFLFILVGYGTKAGFAPMHTWLPDGHGEAPYPVSALLSGVLLKSALYAILRFYTITNLTLGSGGTFTSTILLGSGLFSLTLATPFILKANRFKRVLAYHSLEHMGIITFGLGIGSSVALFGALLHALNHALTKALMFLAFGSVQQSYAGTGAQGEEPYIGVFRAMPATGTLLALGGLALVGAPPFNIFFSEFIILWAAITKALHEPTVWSISTIVLFMLSVTLIFGGLTRHLGRMLIDTPPPGTQPETLGQLLPVAGLLLIILFFGVTIPRVGSLDLARLLEQSVNIVQCGRSLCP
jgi:hydrogenase-4 component F